MRNKHVGVKSRKILDVKVDSVTDNYDDEIVKNIHILCTVRIYLTSRYFLEILRVLIVYSEK